MAKPTRPPSPNELSTALSRIFEGDPDFSFYQPKLALLALALIATDGEVLLNPNTDFTEDGLLKATKIEASAASVRVTSATRVARLALTTVDVQIDDLVYQSDDASYWQLVDPTAIATDAGWVQVQNTPSFLISAAAGTFGNKTRTAVNTSSAAFARSLPASPAAGDWVEIIDAKGTFATNNLTVGRNGSKIQGGTSDFLCNVSGKKYTFVYIDAGYGWQVVES